MSAVGLVACGGGVRHALPPEQTGPTRSAAAARVFELLGRAEVPDAAGAQYVLVYTGEAAYDDRGRIVDETRHGFLLSREVDRFTVVFDLEPRTYRPGSTEPLADGAPRVPRFVPVENVQAEWERTAEYLASERRGADAVAVDAVHDYWADLPAIARPAVDPMQYQRQFMDHVRAYHERWRQIRPNLRLLLLAYRVNAQGFPDLAERMIALADTEPSTVAEDVSHGLIWSALLDLTMDPPDRRDVLRRLDIVVRLFSRSAHIRQVLDLRRELTRMVDEDARWTVNPSTDPVESVIYGLRDASELETALSPLGAEAVPALIAISDDSRLAPALVDGGRPLRFNAVHYRGVDDAPIEVLRYRDLALRRLSSMACRRIANRAEAEQWWSEVQARAAADSSALERDGAPRSEHLCSSASSSTEVPNASELQRSFASSPGSRPPADLVAAGHQVDEIDSVWLERLASSDRSGRVRLAAVRQLWQHQHEGWDVHAEALLIRSIRSTRRMWADAEDGEIDQTHDDLAFWEVLDFLVGEAGQLGFEIVHRVWPRMQPRERGLLISDFRQLPDEPWASSGMVDDALESELADDELHTGGWSGGVVGGEPYSCGVVETRDLAAFALARWFDEPYNCRWPPWQRARARVALLNRWRERRGLPLSAVPPAPVPPGPDHETVARIRAVVRQEAGVDQALEDVALGLVGLASLRAALAAEEGLGPAGIDSLLTRLASTVTSVEVRDPDRIVRNAREWRALVGRSVTATELVALVDAAHRRARKGMLQVRLYRSGNGLGVTVLLEARRYRTRRRRRSSMGSFASSEFRLGRYILGGETQHGAGIAAKFEAPLTAILEAPSDMDGEARFEIEWQR